MEQGPTDYSVDTTGWERLDPFKAASNLKYAEEHRAEVEVFIEAALRVDHVFLPMAISAALNIDYPVSDEILHGAIERGGHAQEEAAFYLSQMPNNAFEQDLTRIIEAKLPEKYDDEEKEGDRRSLICSTLEALWRIGNPETRTEILRLKDSPSVKSEPIILQCIEMLEENEN